MIKKISIAIAILTALSLGTYSYLSKTVAPMPVGGGLGTIQQLDQFTSTSTPFNAITTNVSGADLYIPYSNATTSSITTLATSFMQTILPGADSLYNLGSSAMRWANGYFDNIDTSTITVGGFTSGDFHILGDLFVNGGDFNLGTGTATSTQTVNSSGDWSIGTTDLVVLGSGNVGIGTTAPASKLELSSTATTTVQVMSSGAGLGGRFILEDTDGAGCSEITALNGVLSAKIVTCP